MRNDATVIKTNPPPNPSVLSRPAVGRCEPRRVATRRVLLASGRRLKLVPDGGTRRRFLIEKISKLTFSPWRATALVVVVVVVADGRLSPRALRRLPVQGACAAFN